MSAFGGKADIFYGGSKTAYGHSLCEGLRLPALALVHKLGATSELEPPVETSVQSADIKLLVTLPRSDGLERCGRLGSPSASFGRADYHHVHTCNVACRMRDQAASTTGDE